MVDFPIPGQRPFAKADNRSIYHCMRRSKLLKSPQTQTSWHNGGSTTPLNRLPRYRHSGPRRTPALTSQNGTRPNAALAVFNILTTGSLSCPYIDVTVLGFARMRG